MFYERPWSRLLQPPIGWRMHSHQPGQAPDLEAIGKPQIKPYQARSARFTKSSQIGPNQAIDQIKKSSQIMMLFT
jgi:hypothetical protein